MTRNNNYIQQIGGAYADARATGRAQAVARKVDEMSNSIERLELIVGAMWELIQENGISKEALYKKIDDVIERSKTVNYRMTRVNCPRCGKNIQESNKQPLVGNCVYCGAQVTFYPYSDDVSLMKTDDEFDQFHEEPPKEDADNKPYNISDDLGF